MKLYTNPTTEVPFVPDLFDNRQLPSEEQMVFWIRTMTDGEMQKMQATRLITTRKRMMDSTHAADRQETLALNLTNEMQRHVMAEHVTKITGLSLKLPDGSFVEVQSGRQLLEYADSLPAFAISALLSQAFNAATSYSEVDPGFLLGRGLQAGS